VRKFKVHIYPAGKNEVVAEANVDADSFEDAITRATAMVRHAYPEIDADKYEVLSAIEIFWKIPTR